VDDAAASQPYGDLTTIGRTSGRARTIEIWFAGHGLTVYLLAGDGDHSHWVRNILAHPSVTLRVDDRTYPGQARLVLDPGEAECARDALVAKYQPTYPGDLNGWRDSALPVAIDLDADA